MANDAIFTGWGSVVRGREQKALDVFQETVQFWTEAQQDGRIESFDVVLLAPNGGLGGYFELHGSAEQLAAVREDDDYRRVLVDATLIVKEMRVIEGSTGEGIARDVALYQEAIAKVPQTA